MKLLSLLFAVIGIGLLIAGIIVMASATMGSILMDPGVFSAIIMFAFMFVSLFLFIDSMLDRDLNGRVTRRAKTHNLISLFSCAVLSCATGLYILFWY